MADAQLSVELKAQIDNYLRNMQKAGKATKETGSIVESSSSKIASALAGAFSVSAIVGFGKAVLDATAEYQKFQAVLGNTLGSSALANLKLKELQDFAAETPFGVNELTGAFVKLANSGFKPTVNEMRKLGDLASSTGKSFDQLAEAIIDAQTGEFERLKEFGVRAKDAGDSVIFTYKGVQTQVDKTSESIRNYITSLGDAEGTSGAMAKISETLGGKISNLGDSWDQMLISVGSNTDGVFNSAIEVIGKALNAVTRYNEQVNRISKYKLGSNTSEFFTELNRAINPFASKGVTALELANYTIAQLEKTTGAYVSKTAQGAKTVNDFGKALAVLKKESDNARLAIAPPSLIGGRDNSDAVTLFKRRQNAIQRVYQDAIDAVIAARKNFSKEAAAPSSNFGTSKKDKTLKIKAPELELPENPQKIISDLFKSISAINAPEALKIKAPKGIEIDGNRANVKIGDLINVVGIDTIIRDLKIAESFNEQASEILTSGVVETFASLGESIGTALANGGNIAQAAGTALLSSIGGVLVQLGQMAIGVGIGIKAIKSALQSLNPVVAIAAGVALVALGSIFKAKANSLGGSSGNSGYQNVGKVRGFATGGYNLPGGVALVGEKGPELLNLPTGSSIDNNNKTNRILSSGNRESVIINGNFELGLEKLYIRLEQVGKKMGRKS